MNCINHNVAASATCANCGAPICISCTLIAKGHNVCPTCAPEVRQRGLAPPVAAAPVAAAMAVSTAPAASPYPNFSGGQPTAAPPPPSGPVDLQGNSIPSAQMPSSPIPAQPYGTQPVSTPAQPYPGTMPAQTTYTPPPGMLGMHMDDTSNAALAKARQEDKMRLILGIVSGSAVGLLGSIGIIEVIFYTGIGIPYLYVFLGYGIGAGIWYVTNRGGIQLALASGGIFLGSQIVAHLIFAAQFLAKARADGNADPDITVLSALPDALAAFTPLHWVLILLGLMCCFYAAQRAPR